MMAVSAALVTFAFAFYTLAVWAERLHRYLMPWHLALFWLGLAFDTSGTYTMSLLTAHLDPTDLHRLTGQAAIWLMFGHTVRASLVARGRERARAVPPLQPGGLARLAGALLRGDCSRGAARALG